MPLPRASSLLGVPLAMLLALAAEPVNASAVIFGHNGFNIPGFPSDSVPASGEVNVGLGCNAVEFTIERCDKQFFEVAPHTINWGASFGEIREWVWNDTDVIWTDYHIELEGGIFVGDRFLVDCPVCRNTSTELSDDLTMLWLFFEDGFLPGESFGIILPFSQPNGIPNLNGIAGIIISQTPSVPEPTTLLLLGVGLAGLGFSRRRPPGEVE